MAKETTIIYNAQLTVILDDEINLAAEVVAKVLKNWFENRYGFDDAVITDVKVFVNEGENGNRNVDPETGEVIDNAQQTV